MSEWIADRIIEFADSFAGGTPSRARSEYFNGSIPWISSSEVNQDYIIDTNEKISQLGLENSSAKWIPKNSVLVAMYGATAGQVSKNLIDATSNQAVLALIPKKELIDGNFLYYQVKQNKEAILYLAQGSGQPNLSKDLIDNFIINAPKELDEQRRIAQILTTTDSVIEKTQAAIAKYKAIKQGMLHDLFTRGIDPATNKLRPSYQDAPHLYKESKLGWIPKEWEILDSNQIVKFINGRAYSLFEWETSGTPVIRLQNLTGSGDTYYYSNMELPENQYCVKGDLLYMWSATFGPHIWLGERAIFHYHIWKVECSKKILQTYFYYDLLRFTETVLGGANGSTMAHITKEGMDKRLTIVPIIEEQVLIANSLSAIDNKLQSEQTYLQKLQQIKKGLMEDLLSGKKRVKIE